MKEYINFNVKEVELTGSNLIEASAGTGKTYSIAVLVLRLILEKKILIQDILMVTFTNAAVAELEERIRIFVRSAYRYVQGEEILDETIKEIVDKFEKEEAKSLLKAAILNLDETSVMTIHGFCQQTLTEFAFETGQLFSSELIADDSQILQEETQKFWRKNITGISTELLTLLVNENLNQSDIQSIVKNHIDGKNYIFFNPDEKYDLNKERQLRIVNQLTEMNTVIHQKEKELLNFVHSNFEKLIEQGSVNTYVRNNILPKAKNPESLLSEIEEKKTLSNVRKTYPEIIDFFEEIDNISENKKEIAENFIDNLYAFAIQEISVAVKSFMLNHNLLSYNNLIGNLHKALTEKPNWELENALRKKYKAVFIDEFQDTDREQYEIFKTAFQEKSIIFYIGDPKQSIYAWRKADIATYFQARNSVQKVYGMNVNHRSTNNFIEAMNLFFLPTDDFDTFNFGNEKDKIEYIKVNSPKENKKGNLVVNNQESLPISITSFSNNDEIYSGVAQQVLELLTSEKHSIFDKNSGKQREIRPNDIGILVRKTKNGWKIKEQLNKLGIPAVTVSDTKILNSAETEELIYVLEAMLDGKRSTINRALKSSFVNWSTEKILKLDEEEAVKKFKEYNESWQKNGIYTTLMNFSKDFEIRSYLLSEKANKGERIITNFYHLAEVLYKIESRQHLKPVELTDWLKKNKAKDQSSSDEMVQRIENDENAVNITTIHSSKGLQYSIVLAPDLDMRYESRYSIINLRKNDGNYITAKRNQLTEEEIDEHKKQEEQENRRLIYVALTRAVYTCFLYRNTRYKNTSLSFFTDEVRDNPLISTIESAENQGYYISNKQVNIQHKRIVKNFKLKENAWQQMSYSGLSAHLALPSKENYTETEENYDRFIFKDLRKGAQTGNFLHFIFENLNFSNPDTWQYAIDKAISRFIPAKKEDEKFQRNIHIFLNHVMNAELPTYWESFKLSSLYSNKMLHELEFDFPVSLFSPKQLENLRNYGILVSNYYLDKEIEGMMTGFIDLFFEYKGKYYVLDWKSNYLGPALEDYSRKNLEKAMNENNYHLQYLIYSLAVKKYLKSRLGEEFDFDKKFGGVFYLFVRGMRENTDFGVYHYRPDFSVLQKLEQNVK